MEREQTLSDLSPQDLSANMLRNPNILSPVELESLAQRTGGHAAIPFSLDGQPNYDLLEQAVRKNYADETEEAVQRIIAAAKQVPTRANGEPTIPFTLTGHEATIPDLSHLRFLPGIFRLPSDSVRLQLLAEETKLLPEEVIASAITDLARGVKVGEGRKYYAPFYADGLDTQLEVTEEITTIRARVLQDEGIKIFSPRDRKTVKIKEMWVRGKRLPTYIAASSAEPSNGHEARPNNDHDSGNCDSIFNEANYLGEGGVVLARSGNFVFLCTPDSYAWVPADSVTTQRVTVNKPNPFIDATPQKLLNDFVRLHDGEPYIWGHDDCSSGISRAARKTIGKQLGKYSGKIIDRVGQAVGIMDVIEREEDLRLPEGLYLADMGRVREQNVDGETERVFGESTHVWLFAVTRGEEGKAEYHAYSTAFQLVNGEGATETPVGLHKGDKAMLQGYLKQGRALRTVPLALAV